MNKRITAMAGVSVIAMASLAACGASSSASAATYPVGKPAVKAAVKKPIRRKIAPKRKVAPKRKMTPKAKKKILFPGIPDFVPPWQPPKNQVLAAMARINNRYIVWGNHKIAAGVPGIAATGPNAGALTVSVMNSATIMKKYGGPAIPTSPSAVGAVIKPPKIFMGLYPSNGQVPPNGAVTGLSIPIMQAALKANPWLHVTPQQLMGAYTVAAKYTMAYFGNTPMAPLQYSDPYAYGGHLDQSFVHTFSRNNPASDFTAPGYLGGVLPVRQYMYKSFTVYTLTTKAPFALAQPSYNESQPAGDVVATAIIQNVSPTLIGAGLYNANGMVSIHGRLEIGVTQPEINTVEVALIRSGNTERWYVTATNGIHGNSATVQTFWRAPQGG